MSITQSISTIFWDFDGVIMDSNKIRDKGFLEVLKDYPPEQVSKLMAFHQKNGGLSRYVKFRYFFEEIRKEQITEKEIKEWANKFSSIMLSYLINKELLINETISFIKDNYVNYNMHIVSGSDGKELYQICKGVGIEKYFKSIEGSPTPKIKLVADILKSENYNNTNCALIGDSINDLEAANKNNLSFFGFNNPLLKNSDKNYIDNFQNFNI